VEESIAAAKEMREGETPPYFLKNKLFKEILGLIGLELA
jgi:hypothetical protein